MQRIVKAEIALQLQEVAVAAAVIVQAVADVVKCKTK